MTIGTLTVRSVCFNYTTSEALDSLFHTFREMSNDAIGIALKEKPKNRFTLITLAYHKLKHYGLHTHYILSACEIAYAVYKNKNRKSDPYIKKSFIKLDIQTYALNYPTIRIPARPRQFIHLTLQASDYHLSFINDTSLKRGSVTLTDNVVSIAFSRQTAQIEPLGRIGIDVNEKNITLSDSEGNTEQIDTSEIVDIKARYRVIRAKIARHTQKDWKTQRRLLGKYGRNEKNRTVQRLHKISKAIAQYAYQKNYCIVMENLKGIRKLYRKGNGQAPSFRGRMNSWTFNEIQRQIEYKSSWLGNPVAYVNPRGTSRNCPCGSHVVVLDNRRVWCPACDKIWDRDVLASKNIMARMVLRDRPPRGRGDREPEPRSETVIPRPDGWKLAY